MKKKRQKPERCPVCSRLGLRFYIDPKVGGYTRCSLCKHICIEGGDEDYE